LATRAIPPEPVAEPLRLILGDCREMMGELADNSVHLILTDPPYFLDGLDSGWRKGTGDTPRATGTIGALPVGMRFDPKQGPALQAFMRDVAAEWMRVLAPGGFALAFSQPRLSHRMAVGIEDAGFEIRDLLAWRFTRRAQFKAFSQDHFVRKMPLDEE
jgi:site-specific DNA-methyltransferase (adenine-specific)